MKILGFDVESNGLHGQAFAVGGVLYENGQVVNEFVARCPIIGEVNTWVAENVLPQMADIPETHSNIRTMQDAFWEWLQANKQDAIVLVDVGYPVEARFLIGCQNDKPSREWEAPYPLHDLASILLAAGLDPDMPRVQSIGQSRPVRQHNPVDDAFIAATIAHRVLTAIDAAISAT